MDFSFAKKFLLTFTFLYLSFSGVAKSQSSTHKDSLLTAASQLFDEAKEQQALQIFLKVLELEEDNFQSLWHSSFLYARIGFRLDDEQAKKKHYQQALHYAEKAIAAQPENGYAHFVMAVANGRLSDLARPTRRIKKSHLVKEHAELAVSKIPDYGPAWHMLGLWHSKIANVGSAKKLAAGLFSKGVPKGASNEKAVEYITKAISINPEHTLRYKLDLAKHYKRANQPKKAIQVLHEVLDLPAQNPIDEWEQNEAETLLKNLH